MRYQTTISASIVKMPRMFQSQKTDPASANGKLLEACFSFNVLQKPTGNCQRINPVSDEKKKNL